MYQPKSYKKFLATAASAALIANTMLSTPEKQGLGKKKPHYPVEMRKRVEKRRSQNKLAKQSRKKNR